MPVLGVNSGTDARRCGLASATTYLIHARWECLVRSIHLMTKREETGKSSRLVVAVALVLAAAPVIVGRWNYLDRVVGTMATSI